MPFVKRQVEPVELSRARIPPNITSKELDFITNYTLANIIHQLSSLSKHAEDLFDELYHQSEKLITRTAAVQRRVEQLQSKVTHLDANVEEISLRDISHTRAFRSNRQCQQQVVSRDTMPTALRQLYEACDPPPPLQKLTPYRPDGKDALKFYTDPSYFFELWRNQMLKDTEKPAGQQQAGTDSKVAGGKQDGDKGRRGGRYKSPAGGPFTGTTAPVVITQNGLPEDHQQAGKVIRQPGTNRLDKYRQKAAEQEIIHYIPESVQMPSNQPQVQYQQPQQQQPMLYAAQQQQNPYITAAEAAFQQLLQQQNAMQQVYPTQQQSLPMQPQYQPANAVVQQQQQQQTQQQKPYPAFVVSGMATIPPIIGALDPVQPTSLPAQLWSSSAPNSAVSTIPPLGTVNYSNGNASAANGVTAAVFPGHTPTSASSMLVDENGRPAPPTLQSQQQMISNTLNYAAQQQQHPQNVVIPSSLEQQQQMTMSHVGSALQQHQSYVTGGNYAAGSTVQPHANDIIYHTRTIPPPTASSSTAAIPPSSLPLMSTNLNSSAIPQQQQRTITTGGNGGTNSPSRPMQPPPAPPTMVSAMQQQQSNLVPSPLPPPSVSELTKAADQRGIAQQFQNLTVSQTEQPSSSKTSSIPPPPPPPLPLTVVKPAAPRTTTAQNETDAPNLPAKAHAAGAGQAVVASALTSVKSPEFPPAPPNDLRSDLLAEIRRGIALRKRSAAAISAAESGSALGPDSDNVSLSSSALQNASAGGGGAASGIGRQTSARPNDAELRDVAMLMARRIAIRGRANSDSESDDAGGFTGHSGDTDEWEDKSN